MAKRLLNNVKLGAFVLAGLLFLVVLLYLIGRNSNLFGDTYVLKARFENVQGLVAGNNVRFSGIEAGTVRKINILNDTVIEVTMVMEKKMMSIIRKNAIASVGGEGLVGNRVVNIVPSRAPAPFAVEGDLLQTKKGVNTEEMLQTLYKTNNDIGVIADNLKTTVQHLNNSNALWSLLTDKSIPLNLRISIANIRQASHKAGEMVDGLNGIVMDVKNGKGSLGAVLTDTSFAYNLNAAIRNMTAVESKADSLVTEINNAVAGIQQDITNGKGVANALLKDSMIVTKLHASLDNIQKGTDGFNRNMEAIKHNILFRGYFKKLERQKQKELKRSSTSN